MGEVTNHIAIVLGVLVACFAGPAAALFVLIRRKAKARQSRRSPIGIALLRGAGRSLREQLDEVHNDLTRDLVLLMVVPLLALATFLAQSHLRGLPQTAHLAPVYALAAIAFIVYMLRKLLKAGTRLDHLKAGYDAEVAVGQEPGQLMRQGAATFHDLPAEQFNIDHVMPQAWTAHWPLSDGTSVTADEAAAAAIKRFAPEGLDARSDAILLRQETIPRLGNLTLVHYGVNRSLQNSAFAAKRKALFDHSNLHLNRQLMQLDTWDEQGIAARGEALADLALKIWPGPV